MRTGRLLCVPAAMILAALATGARPTTHTDPPDEPEHLPSEAFQSIEKGGLFFNLTQLAYTLNYAANPSAPTGFTSTHTMTITAAITEPIGRTPFRISDIRIDAFETADGRPLERTGAFQIWPNPSAGRSFTRPHPAGAFGSPLNAQIQITMNSAGAPGRLARIAGAVEVQIARTVMRFSLPKTPTEDLVELIPGMRIRMLRFDETENGQLTVVFEYHIDRLPQGPGVHEAPFFYGFTISDAAGLPIMQATDARETIARNAVVGLYQGTVVLGRREVAELALEVVTSVETVSFDFEHSGLDRLN